MSSYTTYAVPRVSLFEPLQNDVHVYLTCCCLQVSVIEPLQSATVSMLTVVSALLLQIAQRSRTSASHISM